MKCTFLDNTREPRGLGGFIMLKMMNFGHKDLALWGLRHLEIAPNSCILDIGCGGGQSVATLLERAPEGNVYGIDPTPLCVATSVRANADAIEEGRCDILQASAEALPFSASTMDIITAFETIYFGEDAPAACKEILRVLKPGGIFFICVELANLDTEYPAQAKWKKRAETLKMKIYSPEDFSTLLRTAGFARADMYVSQKRGRICVVARKPQTAEETV